MKFAGLDKIVDESHSEMLGDLAQHMPFLVDQNNEPPRYLGFRGSFYLDDEVIPLLDAVYQGNYPDIDLMQIDRIIFFHTGNDFMHRVEIEVDRKCYLTSDTDSPYSDVALDVRNWVYDKARDLYNILIRAYQKAFWQHIARYNLQKRFWEVVGEYGGQEVVILDVVSTDDYEHVYYVVATRDRYTLRREVIIDNLETGVSRELDDFIAVELPKRKAELAAKEEKVRREAEEKAQHESFYGFTDGMSAMEKGRIIKVLDKLYRYEGVVMSRAEHVKSSIESGCTVSVKEKDDGSKMYCLDTLRGSFYVITKTEYDFARYLLSA
nr:MAG TPA: hypothetical protein [Bacteriophage sp.]